MQPCLYAGELACLLCWVVGVYEVAHLELLHRGVTVICEDNCLAGEASRSIELHGTRDAPSRTGAAIYRGAGQSIRDVIGRGRERTQYQSQKKTYRFHFKLDNYLLD